MQNGNSKYAKSRRKNHVVSTYGKNGTQKAPRECKGGKNGTDFWHSQIDFLKLDIFFCPISKN